MTATSLLAKALSLGEEINALAEQVAAKSSESVIAHLREAGINDPCAEAELRQYALKAASLAIVRRIYEDQLDQAEAEGVLS